MKGIGNFYIVSCDFGATGAFCKMNLNDPADIEFFPVPVQERGYLYKDKKSGRKRRRRFKTVDRAELKALIHKLATPNTLFFALEEQQAFPPGKNGKAQGIGSTGRLLLGYGFMLGLLANSPVPVEEFTSAHWKSKMGLSARGKKISRYQRKCAAWTLCCDLHPELAPRLIPKTSHFDEAEAVLMCDFAITFFGKKYGLRPDEDDA